MSLSPPFFALHRGDRIAIVMTTSSGLLRFRAARPPAGEGVRCETSCLTRSIVVER